MSATHTWEEAVAWLRSQPDRQQLVRDCYYDDPLTVAAERFAQSDEFRAVQGLLRGRLPGRVLDLGAGRGIASYAFAIAGCSVISLEPDPSALVGAAAIAALSAETNTDITVIRESGERLPFPDESFDVVYGRAVLHHAHDVGAFCRECSRVLRRGGAFLVTREHVISRREDLSAFLAAHPLHHLYGGEHAFLLEEYLQAIRSSGLTVRRSLGPLDSPINYFPLATDAVQAILMERLVTRVGWRLARQILTVDMLRRRYAAIVSAQLHDPGRLYSFLATRPPGGGRSS